MPIIEGTECNIKRGEHDNHIAAEEYNGEYSLVKCWRGREGDLKMEWTFPQRGKDTPSDKAVPHKIYLGKAEMAVRVLRGIADKIEQEVGGSSEPEDDIPFS